MKFLCGVTCVKRSEALERVIGKLSEPNAYSIRQSMFIAMPELARLMSVEILQESVTLLLASSLSTTISLAILFPLLSSSSGNFESHRRL